MSDHTHITADSMLDHALDAASRGFRVFPLHPETKRPVWSKFYDHATTDPVRIREIWDGRDYNIGVSTDDLIVVDVDVKDGKPGFSSLAMLELDGLDTNTLTVRTPSQGAHKYYRGPSVANDANGKLGDGVDVRGHHGYVIWVGSEFGGGSYVLEKDLPIADFPKTLLPRLASPREREAPIADVELDDPAAIELARPWLERHPPAVEGHGGDAHTYATACRMRDFGLSEETAFDLLSQGWNNRCVPPWPHDSLKIKVENAYAYATGAAGGESPVITAAMFEGVCAPENEKPRALDTSAWAKPFRYVEPGLIPPRRFVYGNHIIGQYLTATVASGGVGKTSLNVTEALAIATGRPLLGVTPRERTRVWIWNGEDPADELQRRITAAMMAHGITPEGVEGWLFVGSGRDAPIEIARQDRGAAILNTGVVQAIKDIIRERGIGVMIADPLVKAHRVTENDNGALDLVCGAFAEIADTTGCAIHIVHHLRKTGSREATADDSRGASALVGAARCVRVLNVMDGAEAQRVGIDPKNRRSFVRVDIDKANMTRPAEAAIWFQLINVPLGNGDEVQAACAWSPPPPGAGLTGDDIRRAQEAVRCVPEGLKDSGDGWRESPQSRLWVGFAIAEALSLNPDQSVDKARLKLLIKNWTEEGYLSVVRRSVNGKVTPIVEVGRDPNPFDGVCVQGGGAEP